MPTKCKKHPRYKALKEPRCPCYRCWVMWCDELGKRRQKANNLVFKLYGLEEAAKYIAGKIFCKRRRIGEIPQ